MLIGPALDLGINLKVLTDPSTIFEFAETCDVLTICDENVSDGLVKNLAAKGVRVLPSGETLIHARSLGQEVSTAHSKIAVSVARSPHGQAAVWAVTEIISEDGQFKSTLTPAQSLDSGLASQAQRLALETAGSINLVGVMNIQMSLIQEEIVLEKITLGPTRFGNWTIDGSITSQFEQHLRAILDLPLGATDLLTPFVVSADVVGVDKPDLYRPYLHVFARDPGVKVHQYGADFGSGERLGHVTVTGKDALDLRERAAHAADYISGVIDE